MFSLLTPRSKLLSFLNRPNVEIYFTHDYDTTARQSKHTTSIDSDATVTGAVDVVIDFEDMLDTDGYCHSPAHLKTDF